MSRNCSILREKDAKRMLDGFIGIGYLENMQFCEVRKG